MAGAASSTLTSGRSGRRCTAAVGGGVFYHLAVGRWGPGLPRRPVAGRVHRVAGVKHVVSIGMKRFNAPTPGMPTPEVLEMAFDEVVLVANDPDHFERGFIRFEVSGGRQ